MSVFLKFPLPAVFEDFAQIMEKSGGDQEVSVDLVPMGLLQLAEDEKSGLQHKSDMLDEGDPADFRAERTGIKVSFFAL